MNRLLTGFGERAKELEHSKRGYILNLGEKKGGKLSEKIEHVIN